MTEMSSIQDLPRDIIINHFYPYITFNTCIRLCCIKSLRNLLFKIFTKELNISLDISSEIVSLKEIFDLLINYINSSISFKITPNNSRTSRRIIDFLIINDRHPFSSSTLTPDVIIEKLLTIIPYSQISQYLIDIHHFSLTTFTEHKLRKQIISKALIERNIDLIRYSKDILNINPDKVSYIIRLILNPNSKDFYIKNIYDNIYLGYYDNKYGFPKLTRNDIKKIISITDACKNYDEDEINAETDYSYDNYLISWNLYSTKKSENIAILNSMDYTINFYEYERARRYYIRYADMKTLKCMIENDDDFLSHTDVPDLMMNKNINSNIFKYISLQVRFDRKNIFQNLKDVDRFRELLLPLVDKDRLSLKEVEEIIIREKSLIYINDRSKWKELFREDFSDEIFRDIKLFYERLDMKILPTFIYDFVTLRANRPYRCQHDEFCIFDPLRMKSGKLKLYCRFHSKDKSINKKFKKITIVDK